MSVDVLELIAAFHLYVLPPIVAAVVLGALLRGRRAPEGATESGDDDLAMRRARFDRERTVRRIGLLNYGLALRSLIAVVPEFQTYATAGSFGSLAPLSVGVPLVVAAVSLPLGVGLRRLSPRARRAEAVWSALVSALTLLVTIWMWHYGAAVDLAEWPDLAVSKLLPPFLLLVMLLPGTRAVVSAEHQALVARTPRPARPVGHSVISALTLGFLVILGSVVIVNALDWAIRIRPEMNAMAEGPP